MNSFFLQIANIYETCNVPGTESDKQNRKKSLPPDSCGREGADGQKCILCQVVISAVRKTKPGARDEKR